MNDALSNSEASAGNPADAITKTDAAAEVKAAPGKQTEDTAMIRNRTEGTSALELKRSLLICALALASVLLLLPDFTDRLNALRQADLIGEYEDAAASADAARMAQLAEKTVLYNRRIAKEQALSAFSYQGSDATDEEYERLPLGGGQPVGWLEIPKLGLMLTVSHGTSGEVLRTGLGHLYGSSLPAGGPDTHAVIAGHSGLGSAELFTNLSKLTEGDLFYMHVLGEVHAYRVDETEVVYPADEDPYLQIERGKDLITLYTCTPPGINDHRLLVRGSRSYPDPGSAAPNSADGRSDRRRKLLMSLILTALIPCTLMLGCGIRILRIMIAGRRKHRGV